LKNIDFKIFFISLLLFLLTPSFLFAVDGLNQLTVVLGVIIGFFTSSIMRGICMIALGILAVSTMVSRGEPGIVKKFVPWIVGTVILLSLGPILNLIWS